METKFIGGAECPTAVMDISGQCQVRVEASPTGTFLHFDGPAGEIKFRISDDDWDRLADLRQMARKNAGVFDWSKYCRGCKERNDLCPNRGECEYDD